MVVYQPAFINGVIAYGCNYMYMFIYVILLILGKLWLLNPNPVWDKTINLTESNCVTPEQ